MNKISGILPSNSRVTTVDLKNSGVARSGMPSFGREVGTTAAAERIKQQAEAAEKKQEVDFTDKAQEAFRKQMSLRDPTQDSKSSIVKDMADKFFMQRADQKTPEFEIIRDSGSDMVVEFAPIKVETKDSSTVASEEDVLAVGQYIDVQA